MSDETLVPLTATPPRVRGTFRVNGEAREALYKPHVATGLPSTKTLMLLIVWLPEVREILILTLESAAVTEFTQAEFLSI